MRALMAAALLLATASWTNESTPRERGRTRDSVEAKTLSADEVAHYAGPYLPAVKACYLEHAYTSKTATGELALKLVVHKNGRVSQVTTTAPGVTGRRLRRLETCIRDEVSTWQFPMRRGFTDAVLPYQFHHLRVPNSGPFPSCWDPKGCPGQGDAPARTEPRQG